MAKLPLSVRLLIPDAEGRPVPASSAESIEMFAAPPGPQPVTPGAVKVVSVAMALVIWRTAVFGCLTGFGSGSS